MSPPARRPPRDCPVCGDRLALTRMSCGDCGTELSGVFSTCEFCGLSDDERALLRVFLAARGNMKELERHLGVSYPTARARFDALLASLGIERRGPSDADRLSVLEAVAKGDLAVDDAVKRL